jgi:hypothetical protein
LGSLWSSSFLAWANALRRVWHQPCWPLRAPLLPWVSSDALLFRSSLLMSRPRFTRFSSRPEQGRRRMGSGGRGALICPATRRSRDHPVPDSQRDHLVHRPHGNNAASALVRRKLEPLWSWAAIAGAAACLPPRNSLPSAHMRCRITANSRATATRARAIPRRLAMFIPQERVVGKITLVAKLSAVIAATSLDGLHCRRPANRNDVELYYNRLSRFNM